MTRFLLLRRSMRRGIALAALTSVAAGCGGLLDVRDPTLIQDSDVANANGANARRLAVVVSFNDAVGATARDVAFFTDERLQDRPAMTALDAASYLDQRNGPQYEQMFGDGDDPHLGRLSQIVTRAAIAIPGVRAYMPETVRDEYLAQLFALRGYAIVQMAEDICPGFPINDVQDDEPVYSEPYATDAALTYGVAQLDSALAHGQDSARFLDAARVVKGRALLDLGRYAEAAATVTAVPTDFKYETDATNNGGLFVQPNEWLYGFPEAVGEREGATGMPFVSASDPRVPTIFVQARFGDPADSLFDQLKYSDVNTPVVMANGIEARLIEAEAALAAGDPSWLTILNLLRQTQASSVMADLTDPGTPSAQVDLLYRERAFWLYLTGHRLGDLRRLIRLYGRDVAATFPSGAYPLGGTYGTATAIPFVRAHQARYNPHITSGCTTP